MERAERTVPFLQVMKPVDFRAQNLPMAGTVFRGNRRKYTNEEAGPCPLDRTKFGENHVESIPAPSLQKDMLTKIIKENHPKMEAQ